MKKLYALTIMFLLAASLMVPAAFGQSLVTGDVTGTVTDPSGAVTPNVAVTLNNRNTGATRTSHNQFDRFLPFLSVAPGRLHGHSQRPRLQQG